MTNEKDSMTLHIENVLETCKRLGVTTHELLKMDYMAELEITKENKRLTDALTDMLKQELKLRKKYEGKQLGYQYAHRVLALKELAKKIGLKIEGVIIVVLLMCGGLQAQKRDNFWIKQGVSATTMFAAGWLQGANEVSVNDYRRFAARHPNANPKWSNPRISFKNKYEKFPTDKSPAFFGSTTIFVWTTDRYHAYNTARNFLVAGNIGITMSLYEKPNWKQIGLQALSSWAAFAIGSGAAHKYYKPIN